MESALFFGFSFGCLQIQDWSKIALFGLCGREEFYIYYVQGCFRGYFSILQK
jgi:hypothetical protein